jgi:hypothetical protein
MSWNGDDVDEYLVECEKPFLKTFGYGAYKIKGYTDSGTPIIWRSESHSCKKCGKVIFPTKNRVEERRRGELITRLALGYLNVHPKCDKRKIRVWKTIEV